MYASLQPDHVTYSWLLRWSARVGGAIVLLAWLALVILEIALPDLELPSATTYYQAAALALVFAGYALGWRNEVAGGILAIIGTVAFFAVHVLTLGGLPGIGAACFAVPGVLFVLASKYDDRPDGVVAQP
jgi:hypothetical protein